MSEGPKLLVVEDEANIASGLKINLELEGYHVDVAANAREGGECLAGRERYDAIILDVMLPDMDGFAFCSKLRKAGNYTPVIMLTARSGPEDRIKGLDVGADDYVSKPFEFRELLARLRSVLRRQGWEASSESESEPVGLQSFGAAEIDFARRTISRDGESFPLTHLEAELARYLIEHRNRIVSREELLEKVWKLRAYFNTRTVDNFIVRLRRYIEPDPQKPQFLVSCRGAGYRYSTT